MAKRISWNRRHPGHGGGPAYSATSRLSEHVGRYACIPAEGLLEIRLANRGILPGLADEVGDGCYLAVFRLVCTADLHVVVGPISNAGIFAQAEALYRQAIDLDPNYAEAYAMLSLLCSLNSQNGWSSHPDRSLREALRLGERAVAIDAGDFWARYAAGTAHMLSGQPEQALVDAQAALTLNPNFARAHESQGVAHLLSGKPLEAVPHFERAIRLDPAFSAQVIHFHGWAACRKIRDGCSVFQGAHFPRP